MTAPVTPPGGAETKIHVSARGPVHRGSERGHSATAQPALAASDGPVLGPSASAAPVAIRQAVPNSLSAYKNVSPPPGVEVLAAGIDSASWIWRAPDSGRRPVAREPLERCEPSDDEFWVRLRAAGDTGWISGFDPATYKTIGSAQVKEMGRSIYRFADPLFHARWGWWRHAIYCEGRLGAMDPLVPATPLSLGRPKMLAPWSRVLAASFSYLFTPLTLPPLAHLRRLDLTVDLGFADPDDGLRFLAAVARLQIPGLKSDLWTNEGRPETCYWRLPSGPVKWRIYCKATQAELGPPGSIIRIERQIRWPKHKQPRADAVSPQALADLWTGELASWADAPDEVIVAGLTPAQAAIKAMAEGGTISPQEADRLVTHVSLLAEGKARDYWRSVGRPYMAARRDGELRRLGLVLDHSALSGSHTVPLGSILRAARAALTPPPEVGNEGAPPPKQTGLGSDTGLAAA